MFFYDPSGNALEFKASGAGQGGAAALRDDARCAAHAWTRFGPQCVGTTPPAAAACTGRPGPSSSSWAPAFLPRTQAMTNPDNLFAKYRVG